MSTNRGVAMESKNYLLMNISILYRCGQKYYDKQLSDCKVTAGQLPFLILIYENEGISMQELAVKGCFDKGTITKSIQKLEEANLVKTLPGTEDKRMRNLYTTDETKNIISKIYMVRREWWERITRDMDEEEVVLMEQLLDRMTMKASQYEDEEDEKEIKLFGLQKLTLLDYPQKMASTIFTGGCNMRCPFCQNSDLVFLSENTSQIKTDDILSFLEKRKHVLEGVCITGGEPLLNDALAPFLRNIKDLGYKVKLDTNGSFPKRLKKLVDEKLIDYVAMDIKNCPDRYAETTGVSNFNMEPIQESITYLLENHIPYEFRTTVVKEYHTAEDMLAIGKWIEGANAYYLQNFQDSECVIKKGLHSCSKEELESYVEILKPYIANTSLRGI